MKPYWFSVVGLILDICGGFLLAAEAIKLDNIRKLRDLYLEHVFTGLESPYVIFSDDPERDEKIAQNRRRGFGRPRFYLLLHYMAGVLLLAAISIIVWSFGISPDRLVLAIWHLPVIFRILVIVLGGVIFIFAGLFMLGELAIHGIMQGSLKGIMAILEAIERNTPTGTTGIIGFVLLFFGFLGQLIGTIASTH